MNGIILHKKSLQINDFIRKLQFENIALVSKIWSPAKSVDIDVMHVNIVIIYRTGELETTDIVNLIPEFRQKGSMPIIVIDEKYHSETQRRCLTLGAQKYMALPCASHEIAFELKNAAYSQEQSQSQKWVRAFDVWLNLERRLARRKDRLVHLRNKEFALLEYLMINRGKLLTKNEIFEQVWDRNADFGSNTIEVHINRLRRKIDTPFRKKLIHTIHSLGYIFDKKPNI